MSKCRIQFENNCRCRGQDDRTTTVAVRLESIFYDSSVTFAQGIHFAYYYSRNVPWTVLQVQGEIDVSPNMIIDWLVAVLKNMKTLRSLHCCHQNWFWFKRYHKLRDVLEHDLRHTSPRRQMGGNGIQIECYESVFFAEDYKRNHNRNARHGMACLPFRWFFFTCSVSNVTGFGWDVIFIIFINFCNQLKQSKRNKGFYYPCHPCSTKVCKTCVTYCY